MADLTVALNLVGHDELSGPLGTAHAAVKGFGETLADVGKTAAGFVLGNLVQDIGGGLSGAFEKGISTAQNFGQATLSLQRIIGGSAESVSGMLAALDRFGLSNEDASRSLGIFSKNIEAFENGTDKAQEGSKGFAGAVNSLGLSLTDATGNVLPMNDLMLQVADKFKAMPDGIEKTADAMNLFGRSGKDMILFLNQGSEGLQEAMDAAKKYGLTLTGENLDAVRNFGLAHKDLDEAMQGLTLQLGLAFMPALSALAVTAVGLAQTFNTNLMPSIHALGAAVGEAVGWVRNGLIAAFAALQPVLDPIGAFLSDHLLPALVGIGAAVAITLTPALIGLAAVAVTAGAGIIAAFLPVALPFIAIGVAVAALKQLWDDDFGGIQEITTNVLGQVGDTLGQLANGAMRDFGLAMDAVKAIWEAFTDDAGAMGVVYDVIRKVFGDSVAESLQPFLQWFMEAIPGIQDFVRQAGAILGNFSTVFTKVLGGDFSGAADTFMATMNALGALIGPKLAEWGQAFLDWLGPMIPLLLEQLGELLTQLTAWLITTGVPALEAKLTEWGTAFMKWVGPAIPPLLRELGALLAEAGGWIIGTALPAIGTALIEWGVAFMRWVAPAIPPLLGELMSIVGSITNWVLTEALPLIIGSLIGWGIAFYGWVADMLPKLGEELARIGQAIIDWVTSSGRSIAAGNGADIGKALMDGIGNAISAAAEGIKANAAKAIANTVQAMKDAAGIASPSQVTFDQVGVPLAQGIIDGFKSQEQALQTTVTSTISGALTRNTDLTEIIKTTARKYGIDAATAIAVAMSEGGVTPGAVGDKGTSFGPFQLHVGGGMGDSFKALTGLDLTDIQTTIQQIDFALSNAATHGWAAWHGAARVGISDWQGIGGQATDSAAQVTTAGNQVATSTQSASDAILAQMQTFSDSVGTLNQSTTDKLAAIATTANTATQSALAAENTAIDTATSKMQSSLSALYASTNQNADISNRKSALVDEINAETTARNQQAAATELAYQHDIQLSRAKTTFDQQMAEATTDAKRKSLETQYANQVQNINQSYTDAQKAAQHSQELAAQNTAFQAQEAQKTKSLNDTLAAEALARQIASIITERQNATVAAQQIHDDAVLKAGKTADDERAILLTSYTQRLTDMKTAFLDKIPPLEGPALDAFNAFMDGIAADTDTMAKQVADSLGTVTAAAQQVLGAGGDVPNALGVTDRAVEEFADTWHVSWNEARATLEAGAAAVVEGAGHRIPDALKLAGDTARSVLGAGGVIPTAAKQSETALAATARDGADPLHQAFDALKTASAQLGKDGMQVVLNAAKDMEAQFPGITKMVQDYITMLGGIPKEVDTTIKTIFTSEGSPGGGGGGGGGGGSSSKYAGQGSPGSYTLPNIVSGGSITVSGSNLNDAINNAAKQTGVSPGAQAGGGTFGGNTNPSLSFDDGGWVPGASGSPVVATVHGGEYVIPTSAMHYGSSGGSIDYDKLAEALVRAVNTYGTFSVGVDQVHSALLQKARRSPLGLN